MLSQCETLAPCMHSFCHPCITSWLERQGCSDGHARTAQPVIAGSARAPPSHLPQKCAGAWQQRGSTCRHSRRPGRRCCYRVSSLNRESKPHITPKPALCSLDPTKRQEQLSLACTRARQGQDTGTLGKPLSPARSRNGWHPLGWQGPPSLVSHTTRCRPAHHTLIAAPPHRRTASHGIERNRTE